MPSGSCLAYYRITTHHEGRGEMMNNMTIRDFLLITLDEAVQAIYEKEDKGYDALTTDLQRVVTALQEVADVVRREL